MSNKATPVPGTEQPISPLTMIAKCYCGYDLVRIPIELVQHPNGLQPWYHIETARVLCNVGIFPSEKPVDQCDHEPVD
jgi:hypothetical protein